MSVAFGTARLSSWSNCSVKFARCFRANWLSKAEGDRLLQSALADIVFPNTEREKENSGSADILVLPPQWILAKQI